VAVYIRELDMWLEEGESPPASASGYFPLLDAWRTPAQLGGGGGSLPAGAVATYVQEEQPSVAEGTKFVWYRPNSDGTTDEFVEDGVADGA
jgi:hypothetical protein